MRFKSEKSHDLQVFAVTGVNTVSFGIAAGKQACKGLLGFAIERADPIEKQRYFVYGFKVFPSVIPQPGQETQVTTFDHPVQSLVWDDFTAKPGRSYQYFFHPVTGTPRNLTRGEPVEITVRTERLFGDEEHDVFFNRGVASSQAYVRRFGNKAPSDLPSDKEKEACRWLSRSLDEAILRFIGQARRGDTLLCCFYEFRYRPVAEGLEAAIENGVDVQLIVDAKVNATVQDGKQVPSFPRTENLKMIRDVGIPKSRVHLRQAKPNDIQHNKFMVLLRNGRPAEVWTGSTNISEGGIFGQTNVGHWLRNKDVAMAFKEYWELLAEDPGPKKGADRSSAMKENASLRSSVEAILEVPTSRDGIRKGVTPVFSPRSGEKVLQMYVDLVDSSQDLGCATLAFGINKLFKKALLDNTPENPIVFLLLEKEDKPNPRAKDPTKDPFVRLTASQNVYQAWGAFIDDPVYQLARETNTRAMQLNQHVSYIHSKFLLSDPLGNDPIVVTGSANFSAASTNSNDENMLLIRGNRRVADIYFTEFNRLFNHYYFRAVFESTRQAGNSPSGDTLFLVEDDSWLEKYAPGTLRWKRVKLFTSMKGAE